MFGLLISLPPLKELCSPIDYRFEQVTKLVKQTFPPGNSVLMEMCRRDLWLNHQTDSHTPGSPGALVSKTSRTEPCPVLLRPSGSSFLEDVSVSWVFIVYYASSHIHMLHVSFYMDQYFTIEVKELNSKTKRIPKSFKSWLQGSGVGLIADFDEKKELCANSVKENGNH